MSKWSQQRIRIGVAWPSSNIHRLNRMKVDIEKFRFVKMYTPISYYFVFCFISQLDYYFKILSQSFNRFLIYGFELNTETFYNDLDVDIINTTAFKQQEFVHFDTKFILPQFHCNILSRTSKDFLTIRQVWMVRLNDENSESGNLFFGDGSPFRSIDRY